LLQAELLNMLFVTLIFILIQLAVAIAAPVRFVYLSLWLQTMPYTWNWDVQVIFNTPLGPLNVIAIQLFGLCLSCLVIVFAQLDRAASEFKYYRWHALFLSLCIVSLTYAPSAAYGLRMIAKLSGPLLFVIVILTVVKSKDELRKVQQAIIGSGVILIGLALLAKAAGISSDPNFVNTGLSGLGPPSMGPPVFSSHMLPVAMLALAAYLTNPKLVNLLLVLATAASIIAALQRTSAGALYIGFSVILFFGTRGVWRILLPMAGLLGLPTLLIFNESFRRRMFFETMSSNQILADPANALNGVDSSGRFNLWDIALTRFFKHHPSIGSGIGATQDYLYGQSATGRGVVHSEYVRLLCEVGVTGLSLFVLVTLAYLVRLGAYTAKSNDASLRAPALAAIGSLVAYLVYCSTDNAFDYASQFGIYVFGLVASAIKSSELSELVHRPTGEPPLPRETLFPNLMR
jgi:O-Antigen ligase